MTMADSRTLSLGGRMFEVPPLPLGATILVYPICQRLTNAGLVDRLLGRVEGPDGAPAPLTLTADEINDLTELAFQAAHAADESLDAKAFLALPVTPPELFAAFFLVRIQCGGWTARTPEDGDETGEGEGAQVTPIGPPTSTSTASSPSSSDTSTSQPSIG